MTWLTWRQFRVQAFTAAAALAAFAIVLAATGPHLASLYATSGISGCRAGSRPDLASSFLVQLNNAGTYALLDLLGVIIVLLAPAVIGLFWGAPLIAIGRAVGQLGSTHFTLPGEFGFVLSRFSPLAFASQGIAPLGYAAFGFAIGASAGALIGRIVPAMAVTLAIFAALQFAMPLWVRPHLFPAEHTVVSVASLDSLRPDNLPGQPGAWLLSSQTVNTAGQPVTSAPAACPAPPPPVKGTTAKGSNDAGPEGTYLDCLASHGIREAFSYQPASRFWALQGIETAVYLALALALSWACFRRLNRRLS